MFNTLDQMIETHSRRSRLQRWCQAILRWGLGIAATIGGLQTFFTWLSPVE